MTTENEYTLDYMGPIEYRDGQLDAIYHSAGRAYFQDFPSDPNPTFEYVIRDHLGSTRLAFSDLNDDGLIIVSDDPQTNELLQEHHYYPFGMEFEGPWMMHPIRESAYQYNGKELNEDLELEWLDYGARWYDPAVGRFSSIDRFAEDFAYQSPYIYGGNNPIKVIDINGDSAWVVTNSWTEEQISNYQSYAASKLDEYAASGTRFTCEDLALSLIIDYASENELPLEITNGTGTYSALSDDFDNVQDFKEAILNTTAASDLANDENTVEINSPRSGDILLFDLSGAGRINHTQVVQTNNRFKVEIRQGNFREFGGRLTHSSNPNSWRYIGSKVQSGSHFKRSGEYLNKTTGSTSAGLYDQALIRRWNFARWR